MKIMLLQYTQEKYISNDDKKLTNYSLNLEVIRLKSPGMNMRNSVVRHMDRSLQPTAEYVGAEVLLHSNVSRITTFVVDKHRRPSSFTRTILRLFSFCPFCLNCNVRACETILQPCLCGKQHSSYILCVLIRPEGSCFFFICQRSYSLLNPQGKKWCKPPYFCSTSSLSHFQPVWVWDHIPGIISVFI